MAKAKTETEIQKTGPSAIDSFDYGENAVDVGEVARGFEGQTNEDVSIPFVKLLQPNSPEVARQEIEGIVAGAYFNTVTKQFYKNPSGMLYIAACTRHEYLQWRPQDEGGGFVGRFSIEDPVVLKAKSGAEFGSYYVDAEGRTGDKGDELSETFTLFGVVCDESSVLSMAILPFKGTGIKCYKNMMTQLRSNTILQGGKKKNPPLFANLLKFTSEFKSKDKNSWWVPVYTPAKGSVTDSLVSQNDERFIQALAVERMIKANSAQIDASYAKMQSDKGGSTSGGDVGY